MSAILIVIVDNSILGHFNISTKMESQESNFMENASTTAVAQECMETGDATMTDCSVSDANEQLSPEFLQRKLYFLLEHLKKMHSELPE